MDCEDDSNGFSDNEAVGPNTDEPLSPAEKAAEYDRLVLENQALKVRLRKARDQLNEQDDDVVSVSIEAFTIQKARELSAEQQGKADAEKFLAAANDPVKKVIHLAVAQAYLDKLMALLHAESKYPHSSNRIGHLPSFLMVLTLEVGRAQAAFNGAAFVPSESASLSVEEKCSKLANALGDSREALRRSENILGSVKASYQSKIDNLEADLKKVNADLQAAIKARDAFHNEEKKTRELLKCSRQNVDAIKAKYDASLEKLRDGSVAVNKICQLEAEMKTAVEKATFSVRQDLIQQTMKSDRLADEIAEQRLTIDRLRQQLEDSQDIIAALQSIDEDRHRQSERNLFESRLKANEEESPLRSLIVPMPRTLAEAAEKSKKYGGK